MNVYVESNFVLELALVQEQSASCVEILRLGEAGRIRLFIPGYCLTEPLDTIVRRHKDRRRLRQELNAELQQLMRTFHYQERLQRFHEITDLLLESTDHESERLVTVQSRLLSFAEVIALDAPILARWPRYQVQYELSPQDSIVCGSVLSHLSRSSPAKSCFLNRNSYDFEDPSIFEALNEFNCKLLPRFDSGYDYIRASLDVL